MGNTKFTQEEIQKIIDLYNSGLFQREIAEIYNTSTSSVARCLRKNGITSKVTLSSMILMKLYYHIKMAILLSK